MSGPRAVRHALALATLVGLIIAWTQAEYFGHEILAEIAIFGILAISLDVVAGFAGMVSLGHGALFGLGAYMYGLFAAKWQFPPLAAVLPACAISAAVALVVGGLASRTHGIFFIMITLAIGEMGYEFFFQSTTFGGDDGFFGLPRPDLMAVGLDLTDPARFSAVLIGLLVVVYLICQHILSSPYGMALTGLHANETRMRALGLPVSLYKASAMGFSGAVAGLAGVAAAMHTQFISPSLLGWQTSGEVLIMVILGGLGSLVGAVIGAAMVVAFKRYDVAGLLADQFPCELCAGAGGSGDYWHFWLGLLLIVVVMTRSNGVVGVLTTLAARVSAAKRNAAG